MNGCSIVLVYLQCSNLGNLLVESLQGLPRKTSVIWFLSFMKVSMAIGDVNFFKFGSKTSQF